MKIWPVFKKEMRLYFTSPVAYVVIFIFLLIGGYFFFSIFRFFALTSMQATMNPQFARDLNVTDGVMRPLFSNLSVILLFLVPMLTMRLFAEEQQTGTMELLLTYPIRDGAVILGKYLAAFCLYAVMLALTLVYPAIVFYFARLEPGALITGYLGMLLLGGAFLAVGLFVSSLTRNQILASGGTFLILLLLWVLGWNADAAGGVWGGLLRHLGILEHNESFAKGVLDTKDLIFYFDMTVMGLFLTLVSLQVRRWKS
jgi:ABC-2 type transport system permease protein